jgi:protein SMG8
MHARGPLFNQYQTKLINDCNSIWLNGRQLCESISLTGHNCVNELHRLSKEGDEQESESDENENEETELRSSRNVKLLLNKRTGYLKRNSSNASRHQDTNERNKPRALPVKPHNSSIVTRAASNCGEFQRDRKDPFDLREANFSFYTEFSNMELISKKTIVNIDFPIFKPTSKIIKSSKDEQKFIQTITTATTQQSSSLLNLSQDFKSTNIQKNKDDLIFPSPLHEQQSNQQLSSTIDSAGTQANLIDQFKQNVMINDEVYLNGMTHSESLPGLLPLFSSWALVSIGKFNDYNPTTGLSQPGFLSNHNYLIPWELLLYKGNCINIFSNDKSSSKRNLEKLAKMNEPPSNPISLKAYIGMEYECPMGHRFICSGPDRLVKVASNGVIKVILHIYIQ